MNKESKLKCNLLSVVLFHVINSCKVFLEVSSNEAFHEFVFVLLKQISEHLGLFFVHWKMGKDNALSHQVFKVDLIPQDGLYDLDSLPSIKLIVGLFFLFYEWNFYYHTCTIIRQITHFPIFLCPLVNELWWDPDGGKDFMVLINLLTWNEWLFFLDIVLLSKLENIHLTELLGNDGSISLLCDDHVISLVWPDLRLFKIIDQVFWHTVEVKVMLYLVRIVVLTVLRIQIAKTFLDCYF